MVAMSVRAHLGNEGLKSGKDVTPGQSCSLGVPRVLLVVSKCEWLVKQVCVPEDLEDLVNLRVTREERLAGAHFGEDATDRPHVDACAVLTSTEENFGSAVPEGDDLC